MTGTIVNAAAIILGAALGILLNKRMSSQITQTIIHGVGLVVFLIGLQMGMDSENVIVPLISIVLGGTFGEIVNIERWLERLSQWAERKLKSEGGQFSRGFVAASLVYLVGPMAILGAINDGLTGDYTILLTKAMLDGITSVALGSSLGIGVAFSAFPVLCYQGSLSLAAGLVRTVFSEPVVREMTATGGILIMGIGLNILEVLHIRVGNLLPALVVTIVIMKALPVLP